MKFSKIRYAGGTVELVLTESPSKNDTDERTRKSTDQPRPEFVAAMKALDRVVVHVCELPHKWAEQIEVFQLTVQRHPKTERRSFVISAKKAVETASGPFVIHTPRIAEADLDDDSHGLSEDATKRVDELIGEAERFLQGKRAQQEMFDGEQETDGDTGDAPPAEEAACGDEWAPYKCPSCHTHRSYPAVPTLDHMCPVGCDVVMELVAEADDDPKPAAEASEPSTNGTAPVIGEQRLEERPEFSNRRAITALQGAGIYDVGQLMIRVERQGGREWLAQVKGLGQKGRQEVFAVIDAVEADVMAHANSTAPAPAEVEVEVEAAVGTEEDDLPF